MDSLWSMLERRARSAGARPLVTWCGDDGLRAELSSVTFLTAVAKTAAVLTEWDVPAGSTVRLDLPLHWQLPVWLAACDLAGMTVVAEGPAEVVAGTDAPLLLAEDPAWPVLVSADPLGLPGTPPAAPLLDHARDAMGQPDAYLEMPAADSTWVTVTGTWHRRDIVAEARRSADRTGLGPGGRLLVSRETPVPTRWTGVWALPLVADAAVVLCDTLDCRSVAATEGVTAGTVT